MIYSEGFSFLGNLKTLPHHEEKICQNFDVLHTDDFDENPRPTSHFCGRSSDR